MRHARHDQALQAIETPAKRIDANLKYIVIVYDGPAEVVREASFVSNVDIGDVCAVCNAVADQIKAKAKKGRFGCAALIPNA